MVICECARASYKATLLRESEAALKITRRQVKPKCKIAPPLQLDGWWAEAYDGLNGFAIGLGRIHSNHDIHDSRDGEDLYRVIHDELIPLFYQRDKDGLPRGWIKRMKRTIRTLGWRFSADRMVMDYTRKGYIPAAGGTSSEIRPPC